MEAPICITCTRYLPPCLHQVPPSGPPVSVLRNPFRSKGPHRHGSHGKLGPNSSASGNPGRPCPGLSTPPIPFSQWPIHRLKGSVTVKVNLRVGTRIRLSYLTDRQTDRQTHSPFSSCYIYSVLIIFLLRPDSACFHLKSVPVSKERAGENLFLLLPFLRSQTVRDRTSNTFFVESAGIPINRRDLRFPFAIPFCTPSHPQRTKESRRRKGKEEEKEKNKKEEDCSTTGPSKKRRKPLGIC